MKIFSSGSCRLLTTINNGYDKVIPIHSMFYNFVGVNFLGKLHNTKQHIQFIQFIKDEIILPNDILIKFLTSHGGYGGNFSECEDISLLPIKKENIKNQFDECEWYIFEICSLKLYKNNGFDVHFEITNDYNYILQTEEELLEDLHTIRKLIPFNKKILFQIHFRPNIIYNDSSKTIEKREIIYNLINNFCEKNKNTFIYDPSILIKTDHSLFDGDTHFTYNGHIASFHYIYNNYLSINDV
jgi:hypothetical protein